MPPKRRSAKIRSVSVDAPGFNPSQFTIDGRPLDRNYEHIERPNNPYASFYVDNNGVWNNRHKDMPEEAQAMADAVKLGFKDIDRTPAVPPLQPGHLKSWTRPKFPTDRESREKLIDIFKNKLKLVRDLAIEEINTYAEESKGDLLKRKQTTDKPVAMLLADPEEPLPISFQAQDLVRLFLCEVGTIEHLENASMEEKETEEWKAAYESALIHRDQRWRALANILQLQLPGEERARKKLVLDIMGDVLQGALEANK